MGIITTMYRGLDSGLASRPRVQRSAPVIRVLVAENVRVLRDTLVALLDLEDDIEVVAALDSGDRIVLTALQHHPDVALLDIDLPGTDGLTATAELQQQVPQCRTLILTALGGSGMLQRARAAGASAFLVKDGPADGLIEAVRRLARGERLIDPPSSDRTRRRPDVLGPYADADEAPGDEAQRRDTLEETDRAVGPGSACGG